jgi:hypothetical protein
MPRNNIRCAATCIGGQPCVLDGAHPHTLHNCPNPACACHKSAADNAADRAYTAALGRIAARYGHDPDIRMILLHNGVLRFLDAPDPA